MNSFYKSFLFLVFFMPFFSGAQIKLPAIISDNMILQQNAKVALWGWAQPGEKVSITNTWNNKSISVTTAASGKWLTYVNTIKAGGPYQLTFKASNSVGIKNILLGEVWLASGQSNMEFFVGKTSSASYTGVINHDDVMKDAEHPDIRTIDVPNKVADEPQTDFKGEWKLCSARTVDSFSAVAYFFAKEINKATGFPVGIINSTWGGTPAESWTERQVLQSNAVLAQPCGGFVRLVPLKSHCGDACAVSSARRRSVNSMGSVLATLNSIGNRAERVALG